MLQMGPEDRSAAADEAVDWKARATKLKRQALTFKTKYSEAAAARDTAIAELQALKEVRGSIMRWAISTPIRGRLVGMYACGASLACAHLM